MLKFIEHISSAEYWFHGNFVDQSAHLPRPFVASGHFLNNAGMLLFEGTYRLAQRDTAYPVNVRVLSWATNAVVIEVSSPHLGRLRGHWHFLGETHELLATSATGSAAATHLQLEPNAKLRVCGSAKHGAVSVAFTGLGAPGTDSEELGNVVRVLSGRRA